MCDVAHFRKTEHQPERGVHAVDGAAVTLDCSSPSSAYTDYIFWYKKEVNSLPDFILSTYQFGQVKKAEKYRERFRCSMNASARQASLHIERVKPSDSGVFYCALRPTLTHSLACLHKNTCTHLTSEVTLGPCLSHTKQNRKGRKKSFCPFEAHQNLKPQFR
uniref:Ig-like domain-containing protein n=1 Tax=Hippocampus comes TaxID=109280 RepID=A0A3Q2X9N0_HIPCM